MKAEVVTNRLLSISKIVFHCMLFWLQPNGEREMNFDTHNGFKCHFCVKKKKDSDNLKKLFNEFLNIIERILG